MLGVLEESLVTDGSFWPFLSFLLSFFRFKIRGLLVLVTLKVTRLRALKLKFHVKLLYNKHTAGDYMGVRHVAVRKSLGE